MQNQVFSRHSESRWHKIPRRLKLYARVNIVDADRRFAVDGALVFANPAADAKVPQYMRQLQFHAYPIRPPYYRVLQLDGFLRQGAHFLANDARDMIRPGKAAVLIDGCLPDDL